MLDGEPSSYILARFRSRLSDTLALAHHCFLEKFISKLGPVCAYRTFASELVPLPCERPLAPVVLAPGVNRES